MAQTLEYDVASGVEVEDATLNGAFLVKTGDGTLKLTAANTISTVTSINAGTLTLTNNSAAGTGEIGLNTDGVQLRVATGLNIANALSLTADGILYSEAAADESVTFSGNISEISGPHNLRLTGSTNLSEIYLTGSNTYTGGTTIDKVTLVISSASNLGTSAGEISLGGLTFGQLRATADITLGHDVSLDGSSSSFIVDDGATLTLTGDISGTQNLVHKGDGTLAISGSNSFGGFTWIESGTIAVSSNSNFGFKPVRFAGGTLRATETFEMTKAVSPSDSINKLLRFEVDSGKTLTLNAPVVNSYQDGLVKSGDGTFVWKYGTSNWGDTQITDGTFRLEGANNRLDTSRKVTLSGDGVLDLNDLNQTVADIDGSSGTGIDLGSGTLTVTSGSGISADIAGTVSGTGSLDFNGSGSMEISGANNFSGGLTISGDGTVQLGHATGAGSGTITISSGALNLGDQTISNAITLSGGTLTGVGTLNSPTITSGTIAPGNSPGLMSFNDSLTLNASTLIQMELGGATRGTQYDAINVTGTLTQAGTLTVTLIDDFTPSADDSFQLFSATSIGGSFATTNLPTLAEGLSWNTDNLATTGTISVLSAVPEPATFATLLGLFALGFTAIRRRREWSV